MPLASIGQRFTAQFLDGIVALAAGALFYFVASALGLALEWAIAGWILYIWFCDGLPGGQSLGKRVTGIRVVHVDTEKPCSYGQSFVRNLAMVLGVIDAAFIVGKQRRRLGDLIAGTKVVQGVPLTTSA